MPDSPRELKVGRVVFPLCQLGDGRVMSWYKDGSRRRMVTATKLPKLKAKLERIAAAMLSGTLDAAQLEAADHRAYLAARETLRPWKTPVDLAAREYAAAREALGAVAIMDAVRFYQRHAGIEIIDRAVHEVVLEFLQAKAAKGVSPSYREQIGKDLARFDAAFGSRIIADLKAADIDAYLDTLGQRRRQMENGKQTGHRFVPASAWRRNQVRGTLATLFAFARARHYLTPEKTTQVQRVEKRKAISQSCAVISPAQLRTYLDATAEHARQWLPWLAIGAFTGMRTGAILRLSWKHVLWEKQLIEVEASASKIGRQYHAPMHPTLLAWLAPWSDARGAIAPETRVAKFTGKLSRWTCVPWRKNTLRASFISYRYAATGDANLVARECNTSPAEIMEHYRDIRTATGEIVTRDLAEEWFAILPKTKGNVIQADFRYA